MATHANYFASVSSIAKLITTGNAYSWVDLYDNSLGSSFARIEALTICSDDTVPVDLQFGFTNQTIPLATPTPTPTPTLSPTESFGETPTPTPSLSESNTPTPTPSVTPTLSPTESLGPTPSPSPTISVTPSVTPSNSLSWISYLIGTVEIPANSGTTSDFPKIDALSSIGTDISGVSYIDVPPGFKLQIKTTFLSPGKMLSITGWVKLP